MAGSEAFAESLAGLVAEKRTQTVLLSGPPGSGKTAWAEALAAAWLCENPGPDGACGTCASCRYFEAGTHPDYEMLAPEKEGGQIPIENLRRRVHAEVSMAPQVGKRRVWLIEGDALSEAAQNALLKVLEEPPAHAFFVLTVRETARLLPTLLSRAVCLAIPPLSREALEQLLEKAGFADDERRSLAVTFARGLPGTALEIAREERFPRLRRQVLDWLKGFGERSLAEVLTSDYQFFEAERQDLSDIFLFWQSFMRDLTLIGRGAKDELLMHRDLAPELRALAERLRLSADQTGAVIHILNETERRLQGNGNFEMQICRMLLLTREEFLHAGSSRHQIQR